MKQSKKPAGLDASLKRLSLRLIMNFIVVATAAMTGMVLLFFGLYFLSGVIEWRSMNAFIYDFAVAIRNRWELITLVVCLAVFLAILIYYWHKTLMYLNSVVTATEAVYLDRGESVELPADLKPVEQHLNQIQQNVRISRESAREAEQKKSDLVMYLAHDLKTPLPSVIGYLSLLRDEPDLPATQRQKYVAVSLKKAERLEELVNEFFEITRFSLTHMEFSLQPVDVTRMLEQLVYEFKPLMDEKSLTLKLEAEPGLQTAMDPDKMERVFDNLIRNAVFYGFENSTILVAAKETETGIQVSVSNHGPMIPPEKLSRVFEQFFRLDSARATNTGGAGLGLAIARQIVQGHKGTLEASSTEEETVFTVTLPPSEIRKNLE